MKLASIKNSQGAVAKKLRAALYYARKQRLARIAAAKAAEQQP